MRRAILVPLCVLTLAGALTGRGSAQTPQFMPARQVGTIQSGLLTEASGLAASRDHLGVLWVHNDSGDSARVFAMNSQGTHLGIYNLTGATATDCEDIALGPGPAAGQGYIYLGDIGDNNAARPTVRVYRVGEPVVNPAQTPVNVNLSGVETITLQYPDGPRDAETLMVDPLSGDLYIVSKRETPSRVYRAPYPQSTSQTIVLEFCEQLTWGWATGGDIAPGGDEILLRGYASAMLWLRPPGTSVWDALSQPGISVPLTTEAQGEAICFHATSGGYFTTSEGSHAPIFYFAPVPTIGDFDDDGDVDAGDFGTFAGCLGGPGAAPTSACSPCDLTTDGDVDLADFARLQALFTGS